jgi:tRNA (guanine37-N1)-methyltransferase
MVMKAEPVALAIDSAGPVERRIVLSPGGRPLRQDDVKRLAGLSSLLLLCGRYEGVDDRVVQACVDEEVSLGDFVLSGGELGALCVIDAVVRLLPGALGNAESAEHESFSHGLLEHPHYTRPATWRGAPVPEVLLSGHHAEIERWRRRESLRRTALRRPELLSGVELSPEERRFIDALLVNEESEK